MWPTPSRDLYFSMHHLGVFSRADGWRKRRKRLMRRRRRMSTWSEMLEAQMLLKDAAADLEGKAIRSQRRGWRLGRSDIYGRSADEASGRSSEWRQGAQNLSEMKTKSPSEGKSWKREHIHGSTFGDAYCLHETKNSHNVAWTSHINMELYLYIHVLTHGTSYLKMCSCKIAFRPTKHLGDKVMRIEVQELSPEMVG